jgi:hypothetical protein
MFAPVHRTMADAAASPPHQHDAFSSPSPCLFSDMIAAMDWDEFDQSGQTEIYADMLIYLC